jgi:surface antigen
MPAGGSTFSKRQKEQNRLQKHQEKAERKKQRALEKSGSGPEIDWEGAARQFGDAPPDSAGDESE